MQGLIPNKLPIPVIMGPTASGKSSLAMEIAQRVSGEIISADSMQVYRGLDIGTAKPTSEEMGIVPHHLVDILDIGERLDVFKFVELAEQYINEIRARGNLPIIAGGSGLYIRSLLYGLDPMPVDSEIRKELDEKYDSEEGYVKLKELMKELDPIDYERWHMHQRKLIRALEVFKITGKSITELQTMHKPELRFPVKSWILCWDREVLKDRIRIRTAQMLEAGWIEETKKMNENGIFDSPTAHQVLGYKYITSYLNGELSRSELQEKIATKTWQFARRQITWFENKHPEAEKVMMPVDVGLLISKLTTAS